MLQGFGYLGLHLYDTSLEFNPYSDSNYFFNKFRGTNNISIFAAQEALI